MSHLNPRIFFIRLFLLNTKNPYISLQKNIRFLFISMLFLFTACQLKPTQVRQDYQPNLSVPKKSSAENSEVAATAAMTLAEKQWITVIQSSKEFQPAQINEKTVILDARSAFEYQTSHVRGSFHLRWEDFTITTDKYKGVLVEDLYFHTRRLARMGISNQSFVVIIGNGLKGDGSEGRLAWTLKQLGIQNIQILTLNSVRLPMSAMSTDLRNEVSSWKPADFISIKNEKDLVDLVKHNLEESAKWLVLDVRNEKDYLAKTKQNIELDLKWQRWCPQCEVINIPWKEFYNLNGSCKSETLQHLALIQQNYQKNNLNKQIKIIVSSEQGLESGIAAFCLQAVTKEKQWVYWDVYMLEGGFKSLMQ